MNAERAKLCIGLDVGSTAVKAVVLEHSSRQILWRGYQRHETRSLEVAQQMLEKVCTETGARPGHDLFSVTGVGSQLIAKATGAAYVQEVNAVSTAAQLLYPDCRSIVELGGQDAKIVVFKEHGGELRRHASLNDKCAGGTGSVIDKLGKKLGFDADGLQGVRYTGQRIHPVAGKCGVFAETDLIGLQKQGVPEDELVASLFEAIVLQNLSVLTRGHTLLPQVLLVGGPHAFMPGLVEAWRQAIYNLWQERGVSVEEEALPQQIMVPENAEYFTALGAVLVGLEEETTSTLVAPARVLELVDEQRAQAKSRFSRPPLVADEAELKAFLNAYQRPPFHTVGLNPGQCVQAYLGIDGGSTSTKAVLIDDRGQVLAKSYRLSCGNPIVDVKQLVAELQDEIEGQGATLDILGCATTGYAKDILKDALLADVALVETVAHAKSAIASFGSDVDVICDVGGQDIKLIFLKDGNVADFRLNTQCSAGNGYFLQGTAVAFGLEVEDYAEHAFSAGEAPEFSYGCAVFLQSDIVDFQRRGFSREEILAGLCRVLPKNIWLYIAQMPNLARLGRRFVLQGGTQYNLAAVKAQVDYIVERFADSGIEPDVRVHPHAGEGGAIGAALEAVSMVAAGHRTTFIGLQQLRQLQYSVTRDESTRCDYCNNHCMRTFIDLEDTSGEPLRQLVVAACETGMAASGEEKRAVNAALKAVKKRTANLVAEHAREVFKDTGVGPVATDRERLRRHRLTRPLTRVVPDRFLRNVDRSRIRIGIPRVMALYSLAPFVRAYFESLGVLPENLVFSPPTSDKLYRDGATRGAIDPCFPSKLALSHVHNLLYRKHPRRPLDAIFFPKVDTLTSFLHGTQLSCACPTTSTTALTVRAAFTKEGDAFAQAGVEYIAPFLPLASPELCEQELWQQCRELLQLNRRENRRAVELAYRQQKIYDSWIRGRGRAVLEQLEQQQKVGIVMLSRPYHTDPGVHHGIADELQKRGYPVLTTDSLPLDADIVERVFQQPLEQALRVDDVWKNSYSENTNRKLWAAKFVARHPNLVALELSSFKCGHDAAVNTVVEKILAAVGTPHFAFKEIDENRPAGAIKIRVETIAYFLERYRGRLKGETGQVDLGVKAVAKQQGVAATAHDTERSEAAQRQ